MTHDLTRLTTEALAAVGVERRLATERAIGTDQFAVEIARYREVTAEWARRERVHRQQIRDLESIRRATEKSIQAVREATQ